MALKQTILASVATLSAVLAVRAAPLVESSRAEVVRAKFAAFNRHDAESIEQLFAADARLRSPDYPLLVGNRPIGDTYRRLFTAIPDARDEVTVLEVGPERVYAQFTLSGHWGGDPAKPITARIISVYRVKSGQICEDDSYYDRKP